MAQSETLIHTGLTAGLAAVALCVLYLLVRAKRQQQQLEKVNHLLQQQQENLLSLQEQLRKNVQPNFVASGISINESISRIDIKVHNLGAAATIDKVVTSTPDIEFIDDRSFPLRIDSNEYFIVTGISKGLPLAQCRYVVQLHYSDPDNNHYLTAIRGEGAEFKITTMPKP